MSTTKQEIAVQEERTPHNNVGGIGIVDVDAAVEFFENYEELTTRLLKPTDYQGKGKEAFKKKSAWRKYATAFNISDEKVDEEIIRDEQHRIISATFTVRAIAPNGRTSIGVASCSIYDKIRRDDTEEPTPFELRKRFSNAENDVIATAHTRAKSRAIADIIGTGEVSAEEVGSVRDSGNGVRRRKKKPQPSPSTTTTENEVIDAVVVPKELVLKSDNILVGEWFKRLVNTLERKSLEINRENLSQLAKVWARDRQHGRFTEELCKELLESVEES